MPSWQSYLLDPMLRVRIKRRLRKARSAEDLRATFGTGPRPGPRGAVYSPGELGGIAGEWAGAGGTPDATMLYLHGGGYVFCAPRTHRPITGGFAVRGMRVFAPDYRLAPEHAFPAAVDDALAAYKAMLESGVAPAALAVGGDSAGGGLTLAMLLAAKDAGLPMPACAVLFSPWTDLANTGETAITNLRRDPMLVGNLLTEGASLYLNGADARNPLASPLYGDLAGLPPLLIQVGESEVLRDDSTRLADRARAAGVSVDISIWHGMPHVWQLFHPVLPEAAKALDQAAAFAKARAR